MAINSSQGDVPEARRQPGAVALPDCSDHSDYLIIVLEECPA